MACFKEIRILKITESLTGHESILVQNCNTAKGNCVNPVDWNRCAYNNPADCFNVEERSHFCSFPC